MTNSSCRHRWLLVVEREVCFGLKLKWLWKVLVVWQRPHGSLVLLALNRKVLVLNS